MGGVVQTRRKQRAPLPPLRGASNDRAPPLLDGMAAITVADACTPAGAGPHVRLLWASRRRRRRRRPETPQTCRDLCRTRPRSEDSVRGSRRRSTFLRVDRARAPIVRICSATAVDYFPLVFLLLLAWLHASRPEPEEVNDYKAGKYTKWWIEISKQITRYPTKCRSSRRYDLITEEFDYHEEELRDQNRGKHVFP